MPYGDEEAGSGGGGGKKGGGGGGGGGGDKAASRSAEQERRKGIAWTEDEHRFVVPASCLLPPFPFLSVDRNLL